MISTMTTTINNNSVSMNVRDVLPALLRMCDPEDLEMYDSTTPTTLDYIGNYRDGIDVMAYQILQSSQGGNTRPIIVGVGAPRDATTIGTPTAAAGLGTQKFVSCPSTALAYDLNRSAASACKNQEEALSFSGFTMLLVLFQRLVARLYSSMSRYQNRCS